jgi:phage-related protein
VEETIRRISFKDDYFMDFFDGLDPKSKLKIKEILYLICHVKWIPEKFMKHIQGVKGLYEIRVATWNGNYRIFCCFSSEKELLLLNCFRKRSMKTPTKEITLAMKLMIDAENKKK